MNAVQEAERSLSPEAELERLFKAAEGGLPGASWLQPVRREAFARFLKEGLPHRRREEWKYTDLRNRIGAAAFEPALDTQAPPAPFDDTLGVCARLRLGRVNALPDAEKLADGLEVLSLEEAVSMPSLWLRRWLQPGSDPIDNLNLAFMSGGVLIRVTAGLGAAAPVVIRNALPGAGMSHTRNVIVVEEGAELTLLEIDEGGGAGDAFSSSVTCVALEAGAKLRRLRIGAQEGAGSFVRADRAELERGASYRSVSSTASRGVDRQQLSLRLAGEGAECSVAASYAAADGGHHDLSVFVAHEAPATLSRIVAKGVAGEGGHGVVQGRVSVMTGAQKSDSHQLARGLLLSEHAEIDHKPELEIYADDVKCGHGAAIGALDPMQLFYMRSRGIPEAEARSALIVAFLAEVTDRLPEPFRGAAENWLHPRVAAIAGGAP